MLFYALMFIFLAALAAEEANKTDVSTDDESMRDESHEDSDSNPKRIKRELTLTSAASAADSDKPCLNWVLDSKFRKEQLSLNIPENPVEWTVPHVKFWFQWAMRQFELVSVKNHQRFHFLPKKFSLI